MEALYVLLIFSLLLGAGFLAAFFIAHSRGQFDDSETPALRILFDDYDRNSRQNNVLIENSDGLKMNAKPGEAKAQHGQANIQGANYGS